MMMTGVIRAKKDSLNALARWAKEKFPSGRMPRFFAMYQLTSIIDAPIMMPGMKPPMKRSPIEVSAMTP